MNQHFHPNSLPPWIWNKVGPIEFSGVYFCNYPYNCTASNPRLRKFLCIFRLSTCSMILFLHMLSVPKHGLTICLGLPVLRQQTTFSDNNHGWEAWPPQWPRKEIFHGVQVSFEPSTKGRGQNSTGNHGNGQESLWSPGPSSFLLQSPSPSTQTAPAARYGNIENQKYTLRSL